MSNGYRRDARGEGEPRHRGPAVPDGEITAVEAIRNVATEHGSRTYLFVLVMAVALMRLAYDSYVQGGRLAGGGYAAIAVVAVVLFVVDSAGLRSVRRRAWLRWGVRAWWLLLPALVVTAVLA